MKALTNILRYLLLVLVWLLSATFIICIGYFIFGRHQRMVTWPFLKEYSIMLAVLLVVYYLVNSLYQRDEHAY